MAAGKLSAPGTPYGPCLIQCAHTDCAFTRKQSEAACEICGKPIGYETRFYQTRDRVSGAGIAIDLDGNEILPYAHANCVEDQIEKKRLEQQRARGGA